MEMKENMRKKEQMKEKEEEEFVIDNYLCVNACQSCCNTLIQEERNKLDKETKERTENWKDQIAEN